MKTAPRFRRRGAVFLFAGRDNREGAKSAKADMKERIATETSRNTEKSTEDGLSLLNSVFSVPLWPSSSRSPSRSFCAFAVVISRASKSLEFLLGRGKLVFRL